MAANQYELNKLFQLKTKIRFLKADLWFLQKCKSLKIFPNYIYVKTPQNMSRHFEKECIFEFKRFWLKRCIREYYLKLANVECACYQLHLKIIQSHKLDSLYSNDWNHWYNNTNDGIDKKLKRKNRILNTKLTRLLHKRGPSLSKKGPQFVPGYVKNLSSVALSEDEESFLNKGLNFAIPNRKVPTVELISDLEVAIASLPRENQDIVRATSKKILLNFKSGPKPNHLNKAPLILRSLKDKNVIFTKADKGNALVILDKMDYTTRVENLIFDGPYSEIEKSPLPLLESKSNKLRLDISQVFGKHLQFKLKTSNPQIPKLYALPKIHKDGNKMRPIVSNINSPLENISKWLVNEFNNIPHFKSFEIRNSFELVKRLKNVKLEDNEILVSFDVVALFPSVPIEKSLEVIEDWLIESSVPQERRELYVRATKLCMMESFFQFNGRFYKQTEGTSMGNPLSPFVANIFMAHLETKLCAQSVFPRIWIRYVDDVFAIIKKNQLRSITKMLNSQYETIKFTYEEEVDGKLPFLDLELLRDGNKMIEFNIYRKPTTTDRFITSDSCHPKKHLISAFRSMVHRLENIPLSKSNYKKEEIKIKEIASINGFDEVLVDNLIKNVKRRKRISEITNLSSSSVIEQKWFKIIYHPGLTQNLVNFFRRFNVNLVECCDSKISRFLTNNKDRISSLEKSGVYEIQCSNCEMKYIGSTKRQLKTRFREHVNPRNIDKSAVASHMFETNHEISIDCLSLLHEVRNNRKLEIIESYYIQNRGGNLLNNDNGPINSPLFQVKLK